MHALHYANQSGNEVSNLKEAEKQLRTRFNVKGMSLTVLLMLDIQDRREVSHDSGFLIMTNIIIDELEPRSVKLTYLDHQPRSPFFLDQTDLHQLVV